MLVPLFQTHTAEQSLNSEKLDGLAGTSFDFSWVYRVPNVNSKKSAGTHRNSDCCIAGVLSSGHMTKEDRGTWHSDVICRRLPGICFVRHRGFDKFRKGIAEARQEMDRARRAHAEQMQSEQGKKQRHPAGSAFAFALPHVPGNHAIVCQCF